MLRTSFLRNGDIFIVLKSYFDRSAQEDSSSITLSGIAADDATWATVEAGWWYTLGNRFPKAAYMYMKEAIPLRCEFDAAKGWDDIIACGFSPPCSRLTRVAASSSGTIRTTSGAVRHELSLTRLDYPLAAAALQVLMTPARWSIASRLM
jgi:hypothetical protein